MSLVASGNLGRLFLPMTHIALARKYRPTRFSDLVAQEHVAAGLQGAVSKGRVAHAYLLTGPRGVGKTSAARILAMVLNCEEHEKAPQPGEPCGQCESCSRIWSGATNLDVVEIDAASNRGVDDARELRERAMYAASSPDRYKVYIVDEAHMLTREAWNALLKILEEPPSRVVFVFATTEPQKIANTAAPVMSRVQRFDFRRIGPHSIIDRLRHVAGQESIEVEEDAMQLIARVAAGGMRDALSLLDQALAFGEGSVTASRVRDALGLIDDEMYAELLDLIAERRTADVFPYVSCLAEAGADLAEFANGAGEVLRALLIRVVGGKPEGLTDVLRHAVDSRAGAFQPGDVLRMLKLLGAAEGTIRRSPNSRLHIETLLVQWTMLDRTVELSEVIRALRSGSADGRVDTGRRAAGARNTLVGRAPERARRAAVARSAPGVLTTPALEAAWGDILDAVGTRSRMVREALGHAAPLEAGDGLVALQVSDSEVHLEGLERGRRGVEEAIQTVLGVASVRVEYRAVAQSANSDQVPPKRLDHNAEQQERLRLRREQNPTFDAIAEALDLEAIE